MIYNIKSPSAVITDTRHNINACLAPVPIPSVELEDGFCKSRMDVNRSTTVRSQYGWLESSGRLDNFRRVAHGKTIPYQGYVFNDSDVYKWLEAAAWISAFGPDVRLEEWMDQVIQLISASQAHDGYLNTYYSLERSGARWTNLAEKHELYCAGHLIQAAVAHYRVTEKGSLLEIAIRLADHIYNTFGPARREGLCGHPEIEMALIELPRTTRDQKYLELASLLIDRRGRGILGGSEYLVDHVPFRMLERLAGHAVRGLYLCCGAADMVLESGDQELRRALARLWAVMTGQQMYITGGVGSRHEGEAFGKPYELPNSRAYAETCAAIASMMWSWRMLQLTGEARYADLLEWTFYNAVLPGISLDGREYFYVYPLQDDGSHRRQPWFECACCPPNISRTLAMLPGYMYNLSRDGLWVNLYSNCTAKVDLPNGQQVQIRQQTNYPWDGNIVIEILDASPISHPPSNDFTLAAWSLFIRLPGWLGRQKASLKINGEPYQHHTAPGSYLEVKHSWGKGDRIEIIFPLTVNYLESHPSVLENTGMITLARGALVYCLEAVDNPGIDLSDVMLDPGSQVDLELTPKLSPGVVRLICQARLSTAAVPWKGQLYRPYQTHRGGKARTKVEITAVPYFAWANRAPGAMQVWLKIMD